MAYTRPKTILTSTSSGTGSAFFVGDARILTLSVTTSVDSASRYTISGSDADGFQAAIPGNGWSVLTTILNAGLYTIDPGSRWIRAEQPNFALSAASAVTMLLNRYYEH